MPAPTISYRGIVNGNTISLLESPGLPDGQEVRVSVQPIQTTSDDAAQAALLRAFGAWSDDSRELDDYLEWNRQQRKIGRREIEP